METKIETNSAPDTTAKPAKPLDRARLDGIRAKQQRGETLDGSERGYLAYANAVERGTFKPGSGRRSPAAAAVAQQVFAQPQSSNPLLKPESPAAPVATVPERKPIDPALLVKTTRTCLEGIDRCTRRVFATKAKRIGADANGQAQIVEAVAMLPEQKDVISETCPDALAAMGIDTTKAPVYAFFGAITTYALTVANGFVALKEIEQMRLEALKLEKELRGNKSDASVSK